MRLYMANPSWSIGLDQINPFYLPNFPLFNLHRPLSFLKIVNKIIISFIWKEGEIDVKSKLSLIDWKQTLQPFYTSGLGIRDLEIKNKTLGVYT